MDMQPSYHEISDFPRMSWACQIEANSGRADISHGPWVETNDVFFCEGAWAGAFEKGRFSDTYMLGTGGRFTEEGLLLTPPDHTMERLFIWRDTGRLIVTNSLALILALMGDDLDENCLLYNYWLVTAKDGLNDSVKSIPTRDGRTIEIHYYHNLLIRSDLSTQIIEKQRKADFNDYASYIAFLEGVMSGVAENARSSARKITYEPISMLSSGYDSCAVTVLSKCMDNKEAITFTKARGASDVADSGHLVSEGIGLKTHKMDRLGYLEFNDIPEFETQGSPSEMTSARELLSRRILLTGFPGDAVWDRLSPYHTNNMIRGDAGGTNIVELKNRFGFIHFPVPFLSTRCINETHAVTHSAEMAPWTLNTRYDRPIPRRIVEEAGIKRGDFAEFKKAAGVYSVAEGLENTLSKASFDSFQAYIRARWTPEKEAEAKRNNRLFKLHLWNKRISERLAEFGPFRRLPKLPIVFDRAYPIGEHVMLIHWATSQMVERYTTWLSENRKDDAA
ncbi:MAG: hypothetical protein AB3N13_00760 [Arenibacterium sp.]